MPSRSRAGSECGRQRHVDQHGGGHRRQHVPDRARAISETDPTIDFKALQTCSDGEVFRWIEDGENSEFPAPVLTLEHAGHSSDDHASDDTSSTTKVEVTTTAREFG